MFIFSITFVALFQQIIFLSLVAFVRSNLFNFTWSYVITFFLSCNTFFSVNSTQSKLTHVVNKDGPKTRISIARSTRNVSGLSRFVGDC